MWRKGIIVGAILFCSMFVFLAWEAMVFFNKTASSSEEMVLFEVRSGEPPRAVAKRLETAGLVQESFRFWLFMRLSGKTLRAGEYALKGAMFPNEVLAAISSGRSYQHSFSVQEGLNLYEIADLFQERGFGSRDEFITLARDPELVKELLGVSFPSLEGYLFPDTYRLAKPLNARKVITTMVDRFKAAYVELERANHSGLERHEAVILASIIEKETGAEEERPVISSVYLNRLRKPMLLQADPTVLYGILVASGEAKRNLTKTDLLTPTPYNTYTNTGLPVGPIANPGRAALEAALQPATTDYYYFVSRNDGTHIFSVDYKAHSAAVRKFQMNAQERSGKSWRDLQKKTATKRTN